MWKDVQGVVAVWAGAAFVIGCYILQRDRWRARQSSKPTEHTYKTGDRVRLKGFMYDSGMNGQKGKLRSPGMAMFDWIVNLDVNGQPVGIYETHIEPLRWWKFWRSRKA